MTYQETINVFICQNPLNLSQICETQNKILEAITQIHDIKRLITNIQDTPQDQENLIDTEPSNDQLQDKSDISGSIKTCSPTHKNPCHSPNIIPNPRILQDDPENTKTEHSAEEGVTPHTQSISGKHKSNMPDPKLSNWDNSSGRHELFPNNSDKLSNPKQEEERIDEGIGDIKPTKLPTVEIPEIPKENQLGIN
jgi:hypothetical protein